LIESISAVSDNITVFKRETAEMGYPDYIGTGSLRIDGDYSSDITRR
jgi:hypothetical protein